MEKQPIKFTVFQLNKSTIAAWVIGIIWIAVVAWVALNKYDSLEAGYDLAVFNQLFWNTMNGRLLENSSPWLQPYFGTHFAPLLLLLTPIYSIFPSPVWLIVMQSMTLGIVGSLLFLIGRSIGLNAFLAISLELAYLLHPSIQGAALDDFHVVSFAPLFLSAAILCMTKDRGRWIWFWLVLLACVREDMALLAAMTAFAWWLQKPGERSRLIPALGLAFYGIFVLFVWMPALRVGTPAPFLARLGIEGGYGSAVFEVLSPVRWWDSISTPSRLFTLCTLVFMTAGAIFLVPRWLPVLLIPGIVFFLGVDPLLYKLEKGLPTHYTLIWASVWFILAPFGLYEWSRRFSLKRTSVALSILILVSTFAVNTYAGYIGVQDIWNRRNRYLWMSPAPYAEQAHSIANSLSPHFRVVASHHLISLVSNRRYLWVAEQLPLLRQDQLPVFLFVETSVLENPNDYEYRNFRWALEEGNCTPILDTPGLRLVRFDGVE